MDLGNLWESLGSVWLVLLVIAFVAIVAWIYWPKNKKRFDEASRIPLEDVIAVRPEAASSVEIDEVSAHRDLCARWVASVTARRELTITRRIARQDETRMVGLSPEDDRVAVERHIGEIPLMDHLPIRDIELWIRIYREVREVRYAVPIEEVRHTIAI